MKLVLAFDIGTTHSGVSYAIVEQGQPNQIYEVSRFPGQQEGVLKVPSLLYYDLDGTVRAVGSEALTDRANATAIKDGWKIAKWWKLHLGPQHLTSATTEQDSFVPPLPRGKTAFDILTDFVTYLFQCARDYIEDRHSDVEWSSVQDSIEFVFTHPNGWAGPQRQQYRRAVERAGLIPSTPDGRSRVRLITDCEANLYYFISNLLPESSDIDPQGVVIVDAGGGSIDTSMYSLKRNPISLQEITPAEHHLQGSVFAKHRADAFLQAKLEHTSDPQCSCENTDEVIRDFDRATGLVINTSDGPSFPGNDPLKNDPDQEFACGELKLLSEDITGLFDETFSVIKGALEKKRRADQDAAQANPIPIYPVYSPSPRSPIMPLLPSSPPIAPLSPPLSPTHPPDPSQNAVPLPDSTGEDGTLGNGFPVSPADSPLRRTVLLSPHTPVVSLPPSVMPPSPPSLDLSLPDEAQSVPPQHETDQDGTQGNELPPLSTDTVPLPHSSATPPSPRSPAIPMVQSPMPPILPAPPVPLPPPVPFAPMSPSLYPYIPPPPPVPFLPMSPYVSTRRRRAGRRVVQVQPQAATTKITMAFLVGGFSTNNWLHSRLRSYFEAEGIKLIFSTEHANKAVATGAVLSHIKQSPNRPLVTSRVTRATNAQTRPPSAARDRWENQKRIEDVQNAAIDKIMDLIGLEHVKEQVLNIKSMIDISNRQGVPIDNECLNLLLVGNPGTGKSTIAKLYADFLTSIDALLGTAFVETTGSKLCSDGVQGAKVLIQEAFGYGGGVIVIDGAHQLVSDHSSSGRRVLDFLLDEMEKNIGMLVFIFAGHSGPMEKLIEHNSVISSRFPYQLRFSDYTHEELMWMLDDIVNKHYNGWMEVEDNIDGLYARVAVRRLARGSGRPGFGNARALHQMFSKIRERQAERVERERKSRIQVDDFLLTKEDLIGPDPSKVLPDSAPWKKLQELIGLESVKDSVRNLFKLLETNYQRELAEKEPLQVSLNRVFLGSPGTGKTVVAKLYAQILAEIGMLSKGEVVVKNPSDFTAAHVGESEKNTKAILESTRGKVLVIDEAYMLYSSSTTNSHIAGSSNPFNTSVIDTMVAEIQSVPGEDRCVLLLGYKDQMEEMFRNVNPGLSRRFAIENAFIFEDFTMSQLMQILELNLKEQDLQASEEAKRVAGDVLDQLKVRPNFGNAGEVENLLGQAKTRYQKRVSSIPADQRMDVIFEPEDFDPNFARGQVAADNLAELFADVVGCVEVKKRLDEYQKVALGIKENGMDMEKMRKIIPTSFVFKGPSGTGKTMIARKFGQIFYDMGFLASAEVVECSATDLMGQFVGHTGPKTKGMFEKALGKVLFIDEAYRLCDGHYAKEAMEEIVGLMTNERFMKKLVVILAGYEKEMNTLLATNPGLSSRFPEEIVFLNMASEQCLELLDRELQKEGIVVSELRKRTSDPYFKMQGAIDRMTTLPSWGNARDVMTLVEKMVRQAYVNMGSRKQLSLSAHEVLRIVEDMHRAQQARQNSNRQFSRFAQPNGVNDIPLPQYSPPRQASPAPNLFAFGNSQQQTFRQRTNATMRQRTPSPPLDARATPIDEAPGPSTVRRDRGVTDAVWNQLQADMRRRETEARTEEELDIEQALREIGRCPMNFEWIRQDHGYRCAGGSHFVSLDEVLCHVSAGI